jgi:hypothetical protein
MRGRPFEDMPRDPELIGQIVHLRDNSDMTWRELVLHLDKPMTHMGAYLLYKQWHEWYYDYYDGED